MLVCDQDRAKRFGIRTGARQTFPYAFSAYAGVYQDCCAPGFYQITIPAAAARKGTEIKAHAASLLLSKINADFIVP
jgi:hypothetical protein